MKKLLTIALLMTSVCFVTQGTPVEDKVHKTDYTYVVEKASTIDHAVSVVAYEVQADFTVENTVLFAQADEVMVADSAIVAEPEDPGRHRWRACKNWWKLQFDNDLYRIRSQDIGLSLRINTFEPVSKVSPQKVLLC